MTKIIPTVPMPSPAGTNQENLWIPANWLQARTPYLAFDEAPPNFRATGNRRPARDQGPLLAAGAAAGEEGLLGRAAGALGGGGGGGGGQGRELIDNKNDYTYKG